MFFSFKSIKFLTLIFALFSLTACSGGDVIGKKETSATSCLGNIDKGGVFGVGYTGSINQIFYDKGKVTSTDNFKYIVDGNARLAYYNTGDISSTSLFFPDGAVINEADPIELQSMQELFIKLKLPKPRWFKIEGEKLESTSANDPVLGNYMFLTKVNKGIVKKGDTYTYTNWEDKIYKIMTVKCEQSKPVEVVTRYGEINDRKAVDTIKTSYKINYNNPTLEIPNEAVLNYTWLLDTKEGRYFIGKPITDVAFGFVMDFINMVAPKKRLDAKIWAEYQKYIVETINNEPEMNKIVLSVVGDKLSGQIPLDGLVYYYCITLDRDTGKGVLADNKCTSK